MTTRIDRRRFLVLGAGAAGALAMSPRLVFAEDLEPGPVFRHGVASGDPTTTSVILWTRVTIPDAVGAARPVDVTAELWSYDDPDRRTVFAAVAAPDRDHTVKLDVPGLTPGTTYGYRFLVDGLASPVGRTKTLPAATDHVRLAAVTCADYTRGKYHAYARLAAVAGTDRDVDAVVHLGDYIYESSKSGRVPDGTRDLPAGDPREARDLAGYRARYSTYRTDPALQAVHAAFPMIWMQDDHETVDGSWRDMADPSNHGDDAGEDASRYRARKAAGRRAAFEWLPIRVPVHGGIDPDVHPDDVADIAPGGDARLDAGLDRTFAFGDLVDLFVLDTRSDRDGQIVGDVTDDFFTGSVATDGRDATMLGAAQERRVHDALAGSTARWRLLGNSVVLSPIKVTPGPTPETSVFANPDQWDGYPDARRRLLHATGIDVSEPTNPLSPDPTKNLVVLTGDVHASMAYDIVLDATDPTTTDGVTGRGSYGVEFVTPSISSAGDPKEVSDLDEDSDDGDVEDVLIAMGDQALRAPNPHMKYIEARRNGYLLLDVTPAEVRADYWLVSSVYDDADAVSEELAQSFVVRHGDPVLRPI